ncbi:MAG: hypothetical protein Q8L14_21705 [Myxococcales bacterium]|nr:hypothetical protein [Myxococcales bacterium]
MSELVPGVTAADDGAHCALHVEAVAVGVCSRCGRFCCQGCVAEQGPVLCPACAPAVADPFELRTHALEYGYPLATGFRLVGLEFPRLALITLAFSIPNVVLQEVTSRFGLRQTSIETIYDGLIGLIGAQAMLAVIIARAEGRALSVGGALAEGLGNFGRVFGAKFRSGLIIAVFTLLLVLPGIWKATLFMFVGIAALRTTSGDPLKLSEALVRPRFWWCLGYGLIIVGVVYVPMMLIIAAVELGTGALSLPPVAGHVLSEVFVRFLDSAVMSGLLYTVFVMLHGPAGLTLPPMRWRAEPPAASKP